MLASSIGVYEADVKDDEETILRRSDNLMYSTKSSGKKRNCGVLGEKMHQYFFRQIA